MSTASLSHSKRTNKQQASWVKRTESVWKQNYSNFAESTLHGAKLLLGLHFRAIDKFTLRIIAFLWLMLIHHWKCSFPQNV